MRSLLLPACLLLVSLAGCSPSSPASLTVFAAASAQDAVLAIGRDFQARTGLAVVCEPDASSSLARRIEQGADADLFLSADKPWADYLEERGLVEQRRDLLANRLVVIVPAQSKLHLLQLKDLEQKEVQHLGLALDPVPAGRYSRQALKKAGVWQTVEKRVREGNNVRTVLTFVERDEVDAGLVYASDAQAAGSKVCLAFTVPEHLHEPIRYPLVLVRRSMVRPEARQLYEYLSSPEAAPHWKQAGFEVLP